MTRRDTIAVLAVGPALAGTDPGKLLLKGVCISPFRDPYGAKMGEQVCLGFHGLLRKPIPLSATESGPTATSKRLEEELRSVTWGPWNLVDWNDPWGNNHIFTCFLDRRTPWRGPLMDRPVIGFEFSVDRIAERDYTPEEIIEVTAVGSVSSMEIIRKANVQAGLGCLKYKGV